MTNRPDSRTRGARAWRRLLRQGLDTGALSGDGLSLARGRCPNEYPMRKPPAPLGPSRGALLFLILSLASAGCARQLAVQDEYLAASRSSARNRVTTQHLVSHHRALQVAQRSCSFAPVLSDHPPGSAQPPVGPGMGSSVASEALRRLCASIPPQLPVAAHGASSNAYQRWVDDDVRKLPDASETAASAAGGS